MNLRDVEGLETSANRWVGSVYRVDASASFSGPPPKPRLGSFGGAFDGGSSSSFESLGGDIEAPRPLVPLPKVLMGPRRPVAELVLASNRRVMYRVEDETIFGDGNSPPEESPYVEIPDDDPPPYFEASHPAPPRPSDSDAGPRVLNVCHPDSPHQQRRSAVDHEGVRRDLRCVCCVSVSALICLCLLVFVIVAAIIYHLISQF